jgi:predicted nuclease of predicted toxin-antitoxin system
MKFLLDVHLGPSLAEMLESDGHTCRLVVKVGDPTMDDTDILELAREHDEVILTHDLDFGTLLAFSKTNKPSIIIFRIEKINSLIFYQLITDNWEAIKDPLVSGAIVIIEPHGVRIRTLPIR